MFQSQKKIKKWGVLLPWRVSPRYQHVIYASGGFSVRAPERGYLPGNPRVPAMEVVFRRVMFETPQWMKVLGGGDDGGKTQFLTGQLMLVDVTSITVG